MNEPYNTTIIQTIIGALKELEQEDDVILLGPSARKAAEKIAAKLTSMVPNPDLTPEEMHGVRLLILHAISNKSFYDWETPTLTGFTAARFQEIAEKLPRE
ncbi:hypothetical protein ACQZ6S_13855 [Agrobacterium tumefaciens]